MAITLTALHIYPIKGLGGISLDHSLTTSRGLRYDRRFLVVREDDMFVTQRDFPKMATVWVEVENGMVTLSAPDMDSISFDAEPPMRPARQVTVWRSVVAAHAVSPEADQWLSEYLGERLRLVYMPEGSERHCSQEFAGPDDIVSFADGYPFLITSEASLADLNERMAKNGAAHLPMNRFRPNLVVKGCDAFAEDKWKEFSIGEAVFRAVKPCARCQVTTTDQASGDVRGPEPLATLSTYRNTDSGPLFGMNLVPVKLGMVRIGDPLELR